MLTSACREFVRFELVQGLCMLTVYSLCDFLCVLPLFGLKYYSASLESSTTHGSYNLPFMYFGNFVPQHGFNTGNQMNSLMNYTFHLINVGIELALIHI